MRDRVQPEFFDELYAKDMDPWEFETSEYEAEKYDATIAALEGRRFRHGLEIGCSIGVLTEHLARECDDLLAVDVAEAALAKARERVPQVRFERREIPEEWPPGDFDLVVCSEVLYYLDEPAFQATLERIHDTTLLAVHWRPPTQNYPFGGDEVHELISERFGKAAYTRRTPKYVLDRWDRCGS
jgi:trans-aconitate methyltransferase